MNKKLSIIVLFSTFIMFSFAPLHAQWARIYGGSDYDIVLSILQTSDGGYIAAGFTESFGSGEYDAWILKLSSNGDAEWQRTYGGNGYDRFNCIQQTSDGGYVVAGYTDSFGTGGIWILKLSSTGDINWQYVYAASHTADSIQQTSDGGYIVAGGTHVFGLLKQIWILKLNPTGGIEWQRTYGGDGDEYTYSIQQTSDGGYVVAGGTTSSGAGEFDAWIFKIDSIGDLEWSRTYGGSGGDFYSTPHSNFPISPSFQQTNDGGYIAAGYTDSFGAGGVDAWILKLDWRGVIEWQKTYGGSGNDLAYSIHQTNDGGYVVAGETDSFGPGGIWIFKLSSNGDIEWQKTYGGDNAQSVQETNDGGYIVAGEGVSDIMPGGRNFFILNLDSDGDIPPNCGLEGSSDASVVNTNISTIILLFGTLSWTGVSPLATNCYIQDTDATVTLLCPGYIIGITSSGGGTTDPPGPLQYSYGIGEEVQIEAIPETDYRFKGWTGDVPAGHENDNPVTITMDSNKHIYAKFDNLYMLTIAASSGGTTDPQPGDYECEIRDEVSVEALPHDGYRFNGWSGDASGTSNPLTITVDSDKSITAHFREIEQQEVSDGAKGPCFIATAAYGSPLHPHVKMLRDFRDKYLLPTDSGRAFVSLYYKYSPFFAELITKYKILKVVVRIQLLPLVAFGYSVFYFGPVFTALVLLFILALPILYVLFYRRK